MGCLGVHFALSAEDERRLRERPIDERADFIGGVIEEEYMSDSLDWCCETDEEDMSGVPDWCCETNKAWDAIHRAFASSELTEEYLSPLHGAVLGGEPLYVKDDYIINLKSPARVRDIAQALAGVTEESFRRLFYGIDQARYEQPLDEDNFEISGAYLEDLRALYARAAAAGRSVIFTASQ